MQPVFLGDKKTGGFCKHVNDGSCCNSNSFIRTGQFLIKRWAKSGTKGFTLLPTGFSKGLVQHSCSLHLSLENPIKIYPECIKDLRQLCVVLICPASSSTFFFFFVFPADRCSECTAASPQVNKNNRAFVLYGQKRCLRWFAFRVAQWDPITGDHWRRMWKCMLMPGGHSHWELPTCDRILLDGL